jgi:hypothetical protein
MGHPNSSFLNHLEFSSAHQELSNNCCPSRIQDVDWELRPSKYLQALLVKGHVAPMWVRLIRTIPSFPKVLELPSAPASMVEIHPPLNPPTKLRPRLTYRVMGIRRSTLNAPFSFYTHILWSPVILNSRNVSMWLWPSTLSAYLRYYTKNPWSSEVPDSRMVHPYM